jgi:hypothetical protein
MTGQVNQGQVREPRLPKLLFITTSLGTKWESYSQALIARGYPAQKRVVIDGTGKWSPMMFLSAALEEDSDYTIHIDEDCFLYDPNQLDELISYLESNEEVVFAGVPDGGHYYREHNPYACNLFFVVFKTKAIRQILKANPNWSSCRFQESYRDAESLDFSKLDRARISFDDYEPYYPFFWAILDSGKKIHYLDQRLNRDLFSTDVYVNGAKEPMARHMWYLRSWSTAELGPYDKVPNLQRYKKAEHEILSLFGSETRFRRALRTQNIKRLAKRTRRRITQTVQRAARVKS